MKKDDQRTLSLIRVIQVKAPRPERCIAITNLTTRKKIITITGKNLGQ